jgi:hypothetical protein
MKKTYKRYGQLKYDINKLLQRTSICQELKNKITILITSGYNIKYKIYNKRYLKEYFDFLTEPTEVLMFEACAKENLRIILKRGFSKKREKEINNILKIIYKKEG